jgi:uncharacterized protein (TIGR02145 family)
MKFMMKLKSTSFNAIRFIVVIILNFIFNNGLVSSQINYNHLKALSDKTELLDSLYSGVCFGSQIWMKNNLNICVFRNGDTIPQAKTATEWKKFRDTKEPAWCYYDNCFEYGQTYGRLYNWYAIIDKRGLAPTGWHVPTDSEWKNLVEYIGGFEQASKLLLESGYSLNKVGENTINPFNALAGGGRDFLGNFYYLGGYGIWWTSTEVDLYTAWYYLLSYPDRLLDRYPDYKGFGFSVRCIKD